METIKNYLEAMFASMPNTPEVKKAKAELLQMMEDKYNELIADGVSENTAVGTVISEFGNLDELAEDLGLEKEVEEVHERENEQPAHFVSIDEIKDYISTRAKSALRIAIGVFLCITCVIWPIMAEVIDKSKENYGAIGMFIAIGIAVGLFVYSGICNRDWAFLEKERCRIDMATADYVQEQKRNFKTTRALCHTVGVILCVISVVPCMLKDADIMAIFLFLFVGVGVFLIVYSSIINGTYESILKLNDEKTMSGSYSRRGEKHYTSKFANVFMELYWPTITCIYLMISFLTFQWHMTWIIWVIAGVLHKIFAIIFEEEEEE